MTAKSQGDDLLIEPTTIGAHKSLAVWRHPKEGTCRIVAERGEDQKISYHLDRTETRALARHLDPEAHRAKVALAAILNLYEQKADGGFDTSAQDVVTVIRDAIKALKEEK